MRASANSSGRIMHLVILALLALVLTFSGRADPYTARSLQAAWNVGHLVAFFIWVLLFLRLFPGLSGIALLPRLILCAVLGLLAGSLIEFIQTYSGRNISLLDITNDVLGGLLAAAWEDVKPGRISKLRRFLPLTGLFLAAVTLNHVLIIHAFDEVMARRQFPVLADFSSPLQLTRFEGSAERKLVEHGGRSVLKLGLDTEQYSGFGISHFPRDWSRYSVLLLSIVNPDKKSLEITCRIHDRRHSDGNPEYSDRFNRSYVLLPGENRLIIPLEDVIRSPATRELDIRQVGGLICFSIRLPAPRTLYLSDIRLQP